jgi:hypothetical protein
LQTAFPSSLGITPITNSHYTTYHKQSPTMTALTPEERDHLDEKAIEGNHATDSGTFEFDPDRTHPSTLI